MSRGERASLDEQHKQIRTFLQKTRKQETRTVGLGERGEATKEATDQGMMESENNLKQVTKDKQKLDKPLKSRRKDCDKELQILDVPPNASDARVPVSLPAIISTWNPDGTYLPPCFPDRRRFWCIRPLGGGKSDKVTLSKGAPYLRRKRLGRMGRFRQLVASELTATAESTIFLGRPRSYRKQELWTVARYISFPEIKYATTCNTTRHSLISIPVADNADIVAGA